MVFVEEGRAGCELISDSERGSRAERAGSCGHSASAAAQRPIPWPPPAGSPAPPPLQRRRRSALSATRPRERCCGIPARVALAGRARRGPRRGPRAQDSARADEGGGGGVCKKQRGAKTGSLRWQSNDPLPRAQPLDGCCSAQRSRPRLEADAAPTEAARAGPERPGRARARVQGILVGEQKGSAVWRAEGRERREERASHSLPPLRFRRVLSLLAA